MNLHASCRLGDTMISAYMLLMMQPGTFDTAIKEIRKIKNIVKISVIAGEYDIIIRVQVKTMDKLLDVSNQLQMIKGIKKTTTQVIEKEISL